MRPSAAGWRRRRQAVAAGRQALRPVAWHQRTPAHLKSVWEVEGCPAGYWARSLQNGGVKTVATQPAAAANDYSIDAGTDKTDKCGFGGLDCLNSHAVARGPVGQSRGSAGIPVYHLQTAMRTVAVLLAFCAALAAAARRCALLGSRCRPPLRQSVQLHAASSLQAASITAAE